MTPVSADREEPVNDGAIQRIIGMVFAIFGIIPTTAHRPAGTFLAVRTRTLHFTLQFKNAF